MYYYSSMKLIVGLGNPGRNYAHTRHNMGFDTIDKLADSWGVSIEKENFKGLYTKVKYFDEDVILLKPLTFMNLSGDSIISCMNFFKIEKKDLLVIYDDLDIKPGHLKLKESGSSGGHNGIKSIISNLGSEEFKRIRVGVGRPEFDSVIDYVLKKPCKEEQELIDEAQNNAVEAIKIYLKESFNKAMTLYNK